MQSNDNTAAITDNSDINIAVLFLCSLVILCGFYAIVKSSRIFWTFINLMDRQPRRVVIPETPLMNIEKTYIIIIHPDEKIELGISV